MDRILLPPGMMPTIYLPRCNRAPFRRSAAAQSASAHARTRARHAQVFAAQRAAADQQATGQGGNWLAGVRQRFGGGSNGSSGGKDASAAETAVLATLAGVQGRGSKGLEPQQLADFEAAVEVLEASGGVKAPTRSRQLDGRWRLLYTSKPGTASPIQRTFTGVDAFNIFQDITLRRGDIPEIMNVVEFGRFGVLRVEAEANTDSQPLPGFTPRKGAGIPLFGKSSTYPPLGPDIRVDFQFSYAAFTFYALPFKIPYPVPFRLLGDEVKGFIDVTYMSAQPNGLRLSRGNKGTLFVLQKEGPVPDPEEAAAQRRAGK